MLGPITPPRAMAVTADDWVSLHHSGRRQLTVV